MEFDRLTTAIAFVVVIALGTGVTVATPMETGTVLMMVLPSMAVFGLLMVALGVKHGEYRASR
jgi:ABC-type proline/glycine betaine transport system permease subunit